MNYHDNEDELLRMQARRRRAGSSGNVPSRSRAASHDGRSFRERESFDSIDDAYFETSMAMKTDWIYRFG